MKRFGESTRRRAACALSMFAIAASAASADLVTTNAPSSLTDLGFFEKSILFTEDATVSDLLSGPYNVQVNDAPSGGAVVTLSNVSNAFAGGVYLASGTLSVPGVGALGGVSRRAPIVLGTGTLRFTGDADLESDIYLMPESPMLKSSSIIQVDNGATVRQFGHVFMFDDVNGNLLKTGPGTLVLATAEPATTNRIGSYGRHGGMGKGNFLNLPDNGDGPSVANPAFGVVNGRFVIDTPDTVTNYFGGEMWVGGASTTEANAETAGHMDIFGGVNIFYSWMAVGRLNGTTTSAPQGLVSTLNIYGGETSCANFNLDYADDTSYTSHPEVNIHGGALNVAGNLRIDHAASDGKINIDGGSMNVKNTFVGYYRDGSKLDLTVSGEGEFVCRNTFCVGYSTSTLRSGAEINVTVTNGGTFVTRDLVCGDDSTFELHFDGGVFGFFQKTDSGGYRNVLGTGTMYVGANGATFDVTETYNWGPRWNIVITNEPGVVDGGLDIVNYSSSKQAFRFVTNEVTLAGGVRVHNTQLVLAEGDYGTSFTCDESSKFRPCGDVAVDALAFSGTNGYFTLAVMGENTAVTNIGLCTIRDFTPPSGCLYFDWMKSDSTSQLRHFGTYDIIKYPASVPFDASKMVMVNYPSGYDFSLTDRVEGAWRIVTFTSKATGSTSGIDPRESDGWQTGTDDWEIGPWLYVHGAGTLTTAAPLLLTPAQNQYAGISVPEDVKLTLAGGLYGHVGGFAKMGAGELALTGDKGYMFGVAYTSTQSLGTSLANLDMFDGTTNGAPCAYTHQPQVAVGRGTLTIGTGSDDPLVADNNGGPFAIGTSTTGSAGAEGDAALVMNSGRLLVPDREFVVGYCQGTPTTRSADQLASSFTMNGGTADVLRVRMAYDTTKNASMDSRFTLNGGEFLCRNFFFCGSTAEDSPDATVTCTVNGGHLSVGRAIRDTQSSSEGRFIGKYGGSAGMVMTYEQNGGEADFWDGFSVYNSGVCSVNLNGGTLRVAQTFNGGNATTLNWNGTTIVPLPGVSGEVPTFRYFSKVYVGSGNAIIDASEIGNIEIQQTLLGSGYLVVRGANTNNHVRLRTYAAHTIAGAIVEKGGLLMNVGNSGSADIATVPVTVKDGGGYAGYYWYAGYSLTLGESQTDTTALFPYSINGKNHTTVITNSFTANGTVQVAFRLMNGTLLMTAGTHNVLKAPKGSIDASHFVLHPALVAQGAVGTFAVTSADDAYDVLTVTVTSGAAGEMSTWTAGASGSWGTAENWDVAPRGTETDAVVFPESLAADITVSGSDHVQTIYQQSEKAVTLSDPIKFDSEAIYDIANSNGVLALAGSIAAADTLTSTRTQAAGTLRITGQVSGAPVITAKSGRVEGTPRSFGAATLDLANATVRFTESGVCQANLLHASADATGLGVEVPEGRTVYVTGGISNLSVFVKTGPGTVVFSGERESVLCGKMKSYTTLPYNTGDNGDVWYANGMGIYAGTVAIDGQCRSTGANEMFIGFHPIADGTGGAYDARMEMRGGSVTFPNTLSVGRTLDAAYDSPANLGFTRRPVCALDIYDGDMTVNAIIMNYCNYMYRNWMRSEINMYGGSLTITSGRFAITHEGTNVRPYDEDNESVVNLYDGLIDMAYAEDVRVNYYPGNASKDTTYPARGIINIYGGTFRTTAAKGIDLAYGNGHGTINLHGGVLEAGYIKRTTADGTYKAAADVYFNGGTFKPLTSGKTLSGFTTFTVGEGGAKFDLGESNTLTIGQALSTTNGIAYDGGVTVTGETASATLTLKVANAFNGPITVNGGTVRPTVAAAATCASGVEVNGGGVFDANGLDLSFGFLRGEGGVFSNGTVTVTDEVAPSNTTFTVEDVVFASGSTLRCPVSGDATSGWTAPYLTVTKGVAKDGTAYLDLGHDETDPLPLGCRVKIAEIADGVDRFPSLTASGTGLKSASVALTYASGSNGMTEVWAELMPSAFMLIIR